MTLKSDAKFKEKLACGFKYDMKDLVNFPKYIRFELKKYRGIVFHDTEVMQNGIINWVSCQKSTQSPKNCTIMGSFCQKHFMFQPENFGRIMCHDTEGWCKI